MPIDESLKTHSEELKKIENNNMCEGFINDDEEKDESDDKKVARKRTLMNMKNAMMMK